jgi:regulator of replication initiation timing
MPVKEPEYKTKIEPDRSSFSREAIPRMEDEKIEALTRMTPIVIGDIFDRVRFLEERISELNGMISLREEIHSQMEEDIEKDISEKQALVSMVTDQHERRNLKLDISILRKEKRHESVQFWKDVIELKTELRTLMEQYEMESKVAGIFKDGVKDVVKG